jgi:hypothetical protein
MFLYNTLYNTEYVFCPKGMCNELFCFGVHGVKELEIFKCINGRFHESLAEEKPSRFW